MAESMSPELIGKVVLEAREAVHRLAGVPEAIRRALVRHAPNIIQETTALFLGLGFYDNHLRNFVKRHGERWLRMR